MNPDPVEAVICEVVMEAAVAQATTAAPWLNLPVVHALFAAAVLKISQIFFEELAKRVNFVWIDVQTDAERVAFETAKDALRAAHASGANIELAKKNFKDTLSNLIRFHDDRLL